VEYFDYETASREAGLSADDLERLGEMVRREFPVDGMLYEFHVMRACDAIADGRWTVEEMLAAYSSASVETG
jgi:hypothetical protein